jgi:hypothetical protein
MDRCVVSDHDHDDDHHGDDDTENSGRRRLPPPAPSPREFFRLQQAKQALNLKTHVSNVGVIGEKGQCRRGLWETRMAILNRANTTREMKRTTFTTSDCNHPKTHKKMGENTAHP